MHVISSLAGYHQLYSQWSGQTITFVPTMGALHEGHQALIRLARQQGGIVVVSIFVNPLQFGPNEDLSQYPRPLEQDLAICEQLGVDAVFTPTPELLYPNGLENTTTVVPSPSLTKRLCGEFRPGHFTGVATIVLKLFNIIRPNIAVFGEKDAQQLAIIRHMVVDLNLPVNIVAHPTVREASGLALSSRNRYLKTDTEKQIALRLYQGLQQIRQAVLSANRPLPAGITLADTRYALEADLPSGLSFKIQYLEAVEPETFQPATELQPGVKLLIAAKLNQVRLIDNLDI